MNAKDLVDRITGRHVEDPGSQTGSAAWAQAECRVGRLSLLVKKFAAAQPEDPDPKRVVVDSICEAGLICRIPTMVTDHESLHPFRADVEFVIQLPEMKAVRKT